MKLEISHYKASPKTPHVEIKQSSNGRNIIKSGYGKPEDQDTDVLRISPMQLDTIELTAYTLKLIENGVTTEELVRCLEGEYSLVGAYLRLFDEMGWIVKQGDKWMLTGIGAEGISRFQSRR